MKFRLLLVTMLLAVICGCANTAGQPQDMRMERPAQTQQERKALMLTVFGTSTEASVTFNELLPLVGGYFPDYDVFVPYTSSVIRNKLNAGVTDPEALILSPQEMLAKLENEGYTEVEVVSTILFPGIEHEKLEKTVQEFAAANPGVKTGYTPPFLSRPENLQPAVNTLGKYMVHDAANLVVAHGTHEGHPAERTYRELAERIEKTYGNARMASVEGLPDLERALGWAQKYPTRDVNFIVFMFVAGDHAENDIASDEDDSMFSAVRKMGKEPTVPFVNTSAGKRIGSLGLDPDYRKLLLEYFDKNINE